MAVNLITSLLGTRLFSVLQDATGYPAFSDLNIAKVEIDSGALATDHPMSTQPITDEFSYQTLLDSDLQTGKVLRPMFMRVTAYSNNISTIEALILAHKIPTYTFSITTKEIIADNMTLLNLDIEHSEEVLSASKLVIEWQQVAPYIPVNFDPSQPVNDSVYGMRIQQPKSLTEGAAELYDRVQTKIGSLL